MDDESYYHQIQLPFGTCTERKNPTQHGVPHQKNGPTGHKKNPCALMLDCGISAEFLFDIAQSA